jgi:hypothetical protein
MQHVFATESPPFAADIRVSEDQDGLRFTGPSKAEFLSHGKMAEEEKKRGLSDPQIYHTICHHCPLADWAHQR